jgi:hypothetical protein
MGRRLGTAIVAAMGTSVCLSSAANVTAEQRLELIRRAQVWHRTNVGAMNMIAGPRFPGAFAPGATVTCDYHEEVFSGATPKFGCTIDGHDRVKVRYGRDNPEVYAGVAATRLLAASSKRRASDPAGRGPSSTRWTSAPAAHRSRTAMR